MPIYIYRCPECFVEEEVIHPMGSEYSKKHCDSIMQRIPTLPQPPIMKKTASDMALDSINSKHGISPHSPKDTAKSVMQGLERNRPMVYSGFGNKKS